MRLEYIEHGKKEEIMSIMLECGVARDMVEKAFREKVAVPDKYPVCVYRVYKHGKRDSYMLYRKKLL